MKKRGLIALLLAVLLFNGCASDSSSQTEASGYTQITMDEAVKMIESDEDAIILDVRTEVRLHTKRRNVLGTCTTGWKSH